MTIYHITQLSDWRDAQETGSYRVSTAGQTLDETRFIHASTELQVVPTAEKFFRNVAGPLCVLVIDEDAVQKAGVQIRYESVGGEAFPHIYGSLPVTAVSVVKDAWFDDAGAFHQSQR